jgi:para-nitrobenzyl esterase
MASEPVEATTTGGRIAGRRVDGVAVFSGIPYGVAERFRRPTSPPPWSGVRQASSAGVIAFQSPLPPMSGPGATPAPLITWFSGLDPDNSQREQGIPAEDCLRLHVVTPQLDDAARPVLVYIHGGGFTGGSSVAATWATRLAAEQDVVIVGITHRLNVFGFLYLAELDPDFPDTGNAGLLDIVLALLWVQDNIAAFGGATDNVTLFGESGGGMKIGTLMAMPEAAGLFDKAIIQSGSRLGALSAETAHQGAQRLLEHLGTTAKGLAHVPAPTLLEASVAVALPAGPVIDDLHLSRAPFDPDAPPSAAGVPLLLGHTLDEMSMFTIGLDDEQVTSRLDLSPADQERLLTSYSEVFPGLPRRRLLERMLGDAMFGRAAQLQADRKAAQPAAVFRYVFAYEPALLGGVLGAFHTAELPLVMRNVGFPETEKLSAQLGAAWASFARTGDPSTSTLSWPRYREPTRTTLVIDAELRVADDPYGALRVAWGQLPLGNIQTLLDPSP